MSRYDQYEDAARRVLVGVRRSAVRNGRETADLPDLAQALAAYAGAELDGLLQPEGMALDPFESDAIRRKLDEETPSNVETLKLSDGLRAILDCAESIASGQKVENAHLVAAGLAGIKELLGPLLVSPAEAEKRRVELAARATASEPVRTEQAVAETAAPNQAVDMTDFEQAASAFIAATGAVDLTAAAKSRLIVGRDREIEALIGALVRCFKPNAMLVGEPGVGKTAIVEGLADRIKEGRVPERLRDARVYSVTFGDLCADTGSNGTLETRMKTLLAFFEFHPKAMLFIDEIHQIELNWQNQKIGEFLKPALARGTLRCIAATTKADYHRSLDAQESFTRRFQTIEIREPSIETTKLILDSIRAKLIEHYLVAFPLDLIDSVIRLADEHLGGRYFPDKAIDIMDRAVSAAYLAGKIAAEASDLEKAVEDVCGHKPTVDPFKGLEERLEKAVLHQRPAVESLVRVVRLAKRKMDMNPKRPDGVLLFAGPSGVGKTALAKAFASEMTGSEKALFRIDMSEYAEEYSLSRLIGSPQGYVGYGDRPVLTTVVERIPNGVLLLDEFEKAHPAVHRLFLQIFEEGETTDHHGKSLSFSRMTIVATTNAAGNQGRPLGFGAPGPSAAVIPLAELKNAFPVELLNRFDEIVMFSPLDRAACADIVLRKLLPLGVKLAASGGIELSYADETAVADLILNKGYEPAFGARELNRAFEELILFPLSEREPRPKERVVVGVENGAIKFDGASAS